GFTGGLVPGVDVYAYLTHPPVEAWGVPWLEGGSMRARFDRPVYDGDRVRVVPVEQHQHDGGHDAQLEVRNSLDEPCATATASLPDETTTRPSAAEWNDVPQARDRPPASPETLEVGTSFGLEPHGFHAD